MKVLSRALAATALLVLAAPEAYSRSCGPPPPAKPQRWTGGESFPPLPLPVTPLRRSEKKRQPSPPALVGKVRYGKIVEGVDENGRPYRYLDWTTDPADMKNLIKRANHDLGVRYRPVEIAFGKFSFSPDELPILYLTGHEAISLDDETRRKLRVYLQDGGTLLCDACCGSEDYLKGWVKEMSIIFPHKKVRRLAPDHPVFNCFYKIDNVGFHVEGKGNFRAEPVLMGINIGCRTAVIMTPYDLSCAWDGHFHEHGKRVWPMEDARRIGVNMICYSLATYQLGRFYSTQKVYFEQDAPGEDRLVIGQIVHGGDWDPNPSRLVNLLKYAAANSTMEVKFKREAVDLGKVDPFRHPILYMTGHFDFNLKEGEVENLRRYLKAGGVLIADACCGATEFDLAFRREIERVLPGMRLDAVSLDDPLFSASGTRVARVGYTPMAQKNHPGLEAPVIYGVRMGGSWTVMYSPFGLGCGWDGEQNPFAKALVPRDSLRVGLNLLVYALTH